LRNPARKVELRNAAAGGELRDDDEISELQTGSDDSLAKMRQAVLVGSTLFLDEAEQAETLEQPGDLTAVLAP
jgi:hypothetical protein